MNFGDCWNKLSKNHWHGMWIMRKIMHDKITSMVIKKGKTKSIFEIGGAYGYLHDLLRKNGHIGSYFGIDISENGIEYMQKKGISCVVGNFFDINKIPKSDICIIEGVIDHQEKWYPMVLRALDYAPYIIVGIRKWADSINHQVKWDNQLSCFNNYFSKDMLLREAKDFGLEVKVTEFKNPSHKNRVEVILEFQKNIELKENTENETILKKEPCVDLMVAIHNRLEFTKECLSNLMVTTDWALVKSLTLFNVGSNNETKEFLHSYSNFDKTQITVTDFPKKIGVVDVMRTHIKNTSAPFLAKIDNDTLVPPRWLNIALGVMQRNPKLDLLGLEAMKPCRADEKEENYTFTKSSIVGGLYLCRRTLFDTPLPSSVDSYWGFDGWQRGAASKKTRGWLTPSLPVCLLDHLPFEPWLSLTKEYEKNKWQRHNPKYNISRSHLWKWKYHNA